LARAARVPRPVLVELRVEEGYLGGVLRSAFRRALRPRLTPLSRRWLSPLSRRWLLAPSWRWLLALSWRWLLALRRERRQRVGERSNNNN
jgi:hypothetical protein